ncbi:hypothetical protein M8J77_013305 [Diaphorina citri]|jgi:Serine/threonine protein kinase|nr:hypothetical protein M8J77_013305 [Diaphorina citri]
MASSLCLPEFEAAKDDFTLISTLGRGQFSTVHKAFDRRRQEYVALKIVCLRSIYEEKTRADCIKEIRFLQVRRNVLANPDVFQEIRT